MGPFYEESLDEVSSEIHKIRYFSQVIPGENVQRFSLTKQENATFRDIELFIAKDMSKDPSNSLNGAITDTIVPAWAQLDHSRFTGIALEKEGIHPDFVSIGEDSATKPDDQPNYWDDRTPVPYSHQLNDGYIPSGIPSIGFGLAP